MINLVVVVLLVLGSDAPKPRTIEVSFQGDVGTFKGEPDDLASLMDTFFALRNSKWKIDEYLGSVRTAREVNIKKIYTHKEFSIDFTDYMWDGGKFGEAMSMIDAHPAVNVYVTDHRPSIKPRYSIETARSIEHIGSDAGRAKIRYKTGFDDPILEKYDRDLILGHADAAKLRDMLTDYLDNLAVVRKWTKIKVVSTNASGIKAYVADGFKIVNDDKTFTTLEKEVK